MPELDATLALSVALSAVIGLSLGGFGGGGSLLAVPVLVYVTRLSPASAVAASLAIVGVTSLVASYTHHRRGQVRVGMAAVFGGSGVVTAFAGAQLTRLIPEPALMLAFSALMVVVGTWLLAGRRAEPTARFARPRLLHIVAAGAAVGAITGFLGVGGGFLIVPALIAFTGIGMREAIGTSLLVIAINSAAGFVGHIQGSDLDLGLVAILTVSMVAGAVLGERATRRVPVRTLQRGFAMLVIVVGVIVAATSLARWGESDAVAVRMP